MIIICIIDLSGVIGRPDKIERSIEIGIVGRSTMNDSIDRSLRGTTCSFLVLPLCLSQRQRYI